MTVEREEVYSGPYVGNGITVAFPITFHAASVSEVGVLLNGADADRSSYTVTLDDDGTGTVTFFVAPVGEVIPYSDPLFTQEVNFEDQGPFYQGSVNEPIDRSALRDLILRDRSARSIMVPLGEAGAMLPPAPQRTMGKVLGFNPTTGDFEVQGAGAFKGDPGGNVMAIGLFTTATGINVPVGTDLVQTSGWGTIGNGAARYAADPVVNAAYVAAHPRTAFISNNGRGFRIAESIVDVRQAGAVADGVTNDTPAAQAATDTGQPVSWSAGTYFMASPVNRTGPVVWVGEGLSTTIICDDYVLLGISGSGSFIDNLTLTNKTAPWTIARDFNNWGATPPVTQSNVGYQPTTNDQDVWSSLTTAQQNQDIGPKIKFAGNASRIIVSRIYGRFVSVMIFDATDSTVRDCDFKGGKNFAAGILFWNVDGQQGINNQAINNTVRQPSFNGIAFARNAKGFAIDNVIDQVGESGIKLWQNTIAGKDVRCYEMEVSDNVSSFAYFDGLDLSSNYPHDVATNPTTGHKISGNRVYGARQTGIYADGKSNSFLNNDARTCGVTGLKLTFGDSVIVNNHSIGNNLSNSPSGEHQMAVLGENNTIGGNELRQTVSNGTCLYAPGFNIVATNPYSGGMLFLGNPGAITSVIYGNPQASMTRIDQTSHSGLRQNATGGSALQLYSEDGAVGVTSIDFHPRRHQLPNPSARINGILALGAGGAELGFLQLLHARNGAMVPGITIAGSNGSPGTTYVEIQCPPAAPDPGTTGASRNVAFWIDEAGNALKVQVKYANGTVKAASIALT